MKFSREIHIHVTLSAVVMFGICNARPADNNNSDGLRISLLQPPSKTRESVNLETETFDSRLLSAYENSHKQVRDNSNVLPLVDTIQEHEKYGNDGDIVPGLAQGIVTGFERFSNFLNAIINSPEQIVRSLNRSINVPLNAIGARLVGL